MAMSWHDASPPVIPWSSRFVRHAFPPKDGTTIFLTATSPSPSLCASQPSKFRRRVAAATLEFAVVAPIVFVFILALIELGRGLMVVHLLTKAARQGCRVGVVEGKSNSDITATVNGALKPLGISSDTITVDINDNVADAANAQPGDEITVVVSVPVSSVSWVPLTKYLQGNLQGKYTLRRE